MNGVVGTLYTEGTARKRKSHMIKFFKNKLTTGSQTRNDRGPAKNPQNKIVPENAQRTIRFLKNGIKGKLSGTMSHECSQRGAVRFANSKKSAFSLIRDREMKGHRLACPALFGQQSTGKSGFSLVELLSVMVIIAVMATLALPSIRSLNSSLKFNQNLSQIIGNLEQARSYAVGQNTYVWVAFYPLDGSHLTGSQQDMSGDHLVMATYASSDGTNPINWSSNGTYAIPYTSPTTGAIVSPIMKVQTFTQLRLAPGANGISYLPFNSSVLPGAMTANEASPASNINFTYPLPGNNVTLGQQPVPTGDQACYVIQFTPSGDAQVASGLSSVIRIDCQPMKASAIVDGNNIASVGVNGLTGLTTTYRQ
jgi:prepilin-type N-terminal cleavage/methylation domain-containing protein